MTILNEQFAVDETGRGMFYKLSKKFKEIDRANDSTLARIRRLQSEKNRIQLQRNLAANHLEVRTGRHAMKQSSIDLIHAVNDLLDGV